MQGLGQYYIFELKSPLFLTDMVFWVKASRDEEIARLKEVIQRLVVHLEEIRDLVKSINNKPRL